MNTLSCIRYSMKPSIFQGKTYLWMRPLQKSNIIKQLFQEKNIEEQDFMLAKLWMEIKVSLSSTIGTMNF